MTRTYSYVRFFLTILGIAIIGLYITYQARNLILGPSIAITTPQEEIVLTEAYAEITGSVHNASNISLNERPIFIDETGHFKEAFLFPVGYTRLVIAAQDRFGRETERHLHIYRTQ